MTMKNERKTSVEIIIQVFYLQKAIKTLKTIHSFYPYKIVLTMKMYKDLSATNT